MTTKFLKSKIKYKTKPIIIFSSVLFLCLLYWLLVWIFLGELDQANLHYIIANNQLLWHGQITNNNFQYLLNEYQKFNYSLTQNWLIDKLNDGNLYQIRSDITNFNPMIFVPIGVGIIWSLIYPILFKLLRIGNIDIIPFSLATSFAFMTLILTGLIPNVRNYQTLIIFARFIAIIFVGFVFFIIFNQIINQILLKVDHEADYIIGLEKENQNLKPYQSEFKNLVKISKDEDDLKYVEIDKK